MPQGSIFASNQTPPGQHSPRCRNFPQNVDSIVCAVGIGTLAIQEDSFPFHLGLLEVDEQRHG